MYDVSKEFNEQTPGNFLIFPEITEQFRLRFSRKGNFSR